MNAAHIAREEEIFEAALEIADLTARDSYVLKACGGDGDLLRRLRRLLQTTTDADRFFDNPAHFPGIFGAYAQTVEPNVGDQLGPYKLTHRIGSGGGGVVFAALQQKPVSRAVAIKILKTGRGPRRSTDAFLAERQALAIMQHPSIARVFDAGATEAGAPYFVMELVHGERITDFSNSHRLNIEQRVLLFLQVCAGVLHAHQKGIAHRDIKPSNILVSLDAGAFAPKIIDFGIAKVTGSPGAETPPAVDSLSLVGTPAYMSPEQFAGSADVDTQTDIYSLGVLFYEILAGCLPFDGPALSRLSFPDLRRLICDSRLPPPTLRFGELSSEAQNRIASERQLSRRQLLRCLGGDLGAIVLKCIEKDRSLRYQTVRDLAEDLERFLDDQPVSAQPDLPLYRFRKFVVRNRLAVASFSLVFATLVAGILVSGASLDRERVARLSAQSSEWRERKERVRAEAGQLAARQFAYVSQMSVAQQAIDANNRGRAREILSLSIPSAGQVDLRGWEWRFLWEATRSDAITEVAQEDASIFGLALSSSQVISCNGAHYLTVRALDRAAPSDPIRVNGYSRALALNPSAPVLAITVNTGTPLVRLMNLATREILSEFPSVRYPLCLAFSADGRLLAGICEDEKFRIWDTNGSVHAILKTPPLNGWHRGFVAFSPNSNLLAVGQTDGQLLILETNSFHIRTSIPASTDGITALAFSNDGSILAAGLGFKSSVIQTFDARSGAPLKTLRGHDSWISSLAFSPAGDVLASGSGDQTIRIWDTATWRLKSTLRGASDEVYSLAFSSDGSRLVSGSKAGEIATWDPALIRSGKPYSTFPKPITAFVPLPRDGGLLILRQDHSVVIASSAPPFSEVPLTTLSSDAELAVNRAGNLAAIADGGGRLSIWDLNAKSKVQSLPIPSGPSVRVFFSSTDPERLVLVDADRRVHSWLIRDWTHAVDWQGPTNITCAALSPNAQTLAVGLGPGTLKLFDFSTGAPLGEIRAHSRRMTGLDFSPDGSLLVSGSEDSLVKIWRPERLENPVVLRGHLLAVESVAFSPDGARVVSGSFDKEAVKVWDLATRQEAITLRGEGSFFHQTAFSPDGSVIGSINSDGWLHLWSAQPNHFQK